MAFAKLRIHTESTLTQFEASTTLLGQEMRQFLRRVCSKYRTYELPKEEAARGRRNAALTTQAGASKELSRPGKLLRTLNLNTYKFHSLGDYPEAIRQFGTTDSYSMQLVSVYFH